MSTSTPANPNPNDHPWTAALPWGVLVYLAVQIIRAILDALAKMYGQPDAPLTDEKRVRLYHSLEQARDLLDGCHAP